MFYALSGKILGKDPAKVNRVAAREIAQDKIRTIDDSFQREEYIQGVMRVVEEHVAGLPTSDLSLTLKHIHNPGPLRVIGDYDFERKGFRPAGLFFQDGHKQPFFNLTDSVGCMVELRYAKPFNGYLLDVRYPVADQQVARAIESHRVNDNLVVRLFIEPVEIDENHTNLVVKVKAIKFETKGGQALGQADRLPGETKS